jgi:hypothetical protein
MLNGRAQRYLTSQLDQAIPVARGQGDLAGNTAEDVVDPQPILQEAAGVAFDGMEALGEREEGWGERQGSLAGGGHRGGDDEGVGPRDGEGFNSSRGAVQGGLLDDGAVGVTAVRMLIVRLPDVRLVGRDGRVEGGRRGRRRGCGGKHR